MRTVLGYGRALLKRVSSGTIYKRPCQNQKTGIFITLALAIGVLAAWEIVPRIGWTNPIFFASLSETLSEFVEIFRSGEIWPHVLSSYRRLGIAYLIAGSLAFNAAALAAYWPRASLAFNLLMATLFPIPKIALLPLFILWLGIGDITKIVTVAFGVFFMISSNTFTGLKNADQEIIDAAMIDGASGFTLITRIAVPLACPIIFRGLKNALIWSIPGMIAIEMLIANNGLGFLLMNAQATFMAPKLFAVILVATLTSVAGYGLLCGLERLAAK